MRYSFKYWLAKALAILVIVLPLSHNIHASTCDSISLKLMEETWREFRAIHPFGFQTVGLKHYGDTCVFVMSEPAEWVKTEDLVALFTKHDGYLIECTQPYGCDGELHDFVGCLRKDCINPQLFRSELFKLLYYTDEKAYYTDLDHPAKHVYFTNKKINIDINSFDLEWSMFYEKFKVSSKKILTFDNLMKSRTSSSKLYFSHRRGFVVWVLDSVGISQLDSVFLKTARKFTLDTDLILGSIMKNGKVAIIGREREVPVNILPPLRSETIHQLLAFSDQPQNPLSMRVMSMIDAPYDYTFYNIDYPWLVFNSLETNSVRPDIYYAPVSMNKMVRNTELGNLMYLTDIILKSWCENGYVEDLFVNYPLPKGFPYPNRVTCELGDSLRVNWRMFNILSIYNTGCCFPEVSSFSTKKDSAQTEKEIQISCNLYSYFAEQQCVDLVRINQYSILLNAFRDLPVRQLEIQETNRQKTPSITVSNKKWLYGGYLLQGQVVKQFVKGAGKRAGQGAVQRAEQLAAQRARQLAAQRAGQLAAQRAGQLAAQRAGQVAPQSGGLVLPPVPKKVVTTRVAPLTPFQNLASKFRKNVIHPQPNDTERGFDPKIHNKTSTNLLLSQPEKQDLLDKSNKEKKRMEDLRLQLRQFNIPIKVIQNEQRIIIHAITILNNYEKGCKYEWAA